MLALGATAKASWLPFPTLSVLLLSTPTLLQVAPWLQVAEEAAGGDVLPGGLLSTRFELSKEQQQQLHLQIPNPVELLSKVPICFHKEVEEMLLSPRGGFVVLSSG